MKVLSFTKILEDVSSEPGDRHFEGEIKHLDVLLNDANAKKLEQRHAGLFCFLAFHPGIDKAILEYVLSGALGSDSGKKILVLFISTNEVRTPRTISSNDLVSGVELEESIHPAYEIVNDIFGGNNRQSLPGLLVFTKLVNLPQAVFVSLGSFKSAVSVRQACQKIFALAEAAMLESPELADKFFDLLAVKLALTNLQYARTTSTSFREWLVRLYKFLKKHAKDLVAVIPKIIPGTAPVGE